MLNKDNMNEALADAVMDRPREFFIGERRFCLWSPSLGMSLMLERHIRELGIDDELMTKKPTMEVMRLVKDKRNQICDILSIHSFRKFRDLCNSARISERSDYFFSNLDDNELSKLFMIVLSEPNAETLISLSPIGEQREKQALIAKIKSSANSLTFGGNTIYGMLIAPAMTTFHLSFHEAVWGISLTNLKMLLADNINSVYLSDKEAKKYGMATEKPQTIGMSAEDFDRLKAEFRD